MPLFSPILVTFFHSSTAYVAQHHADQLGTFLVDTFDKALGPSNGLGFRQKQALGRMLLQSWTPHLIQHEPEALTPLASLVRDKGKELAERKKPLCCNSLVAKELASAMVGSYVSKWPNTVGSFLDHAFTQVGAEHPDDYRLFRPLGQYAMGGIVLKDVKDRDQYQNAWMKVKSRKHEPLVFEPPPPTEPSPGTSPQPEDSWPNGIDLDRLWGEQDAEEEERKAATRLNVIPEKVEEYQPIVCDDNEPAFVAGMEHRRFGKVLVMVALSGHNEEGQMVYRGGLVYIPKAGREITHRYLDSALPEFDPVSWENDKDGRALAKAVPWRKGIYGKYWTNVKRGDEQWGDIESMKRHFILGDFPEIQFVDRETYDRQRRRVKRALARP